MFPQGQHKNVDDIKVPRGIQNAVVLKDEKIMKSKYEIVQNISLITHFNFNYAKKRKLLICVKWEIQT